MFELLTRLSAAEAISVAYYTIRLIRHRRDIADIHEGLRVEGLETEPSSEDQIQAESILRALEAAENCALSDFDDVTADEYIMQIATIAHERARQQFGYDSDLGQEWLELLREPAGAASSSSGW